MTNYTDKWRMYGLVNYQLSGIQKGIQFGHAVVEYSLEHHNKPEYQEWANNCKTFIILNGGTTNTRYDENDNHIGSLNNHRQTLFDEGIEFASFFETDLGDQLTAIVFLVPEQVYNKKLYPEFWDWEPAITQAESGELLEYKFRGNLSSQLAQLHEKWVNEVLGGKQNYVLREFTKKFKLA